LGFGFFGVFFGGVVKGGLGVGVGGWFLSVLRGVFFFFEKVFFLGFFSVEGGFCVYFF